MTPPSTAPDSAPSEHNADIYRLLAEQAGMVVYDYQPESGHITWSGATNSLLGYSPR
ncbi:MAG: hypothetical protein QM760_09965 [Nibricoccus sp.]